MLCCLCFFAHLGARRHEQHVRERWVAFRKVEEQKVELLESSQFSKGMQAVAEALCDLVIKLGEDLRVLGTSRRLNAFFGLDMQGRLMTEVVLEQETKSSKRKLSV